MYKMTIINFAQDLFVIYSQVRDRRPGANTRIRRLKLTARQN